MLSEMEIAQGMQYGERIEPDSLLEKLEIDKEAEETRTH
jgi:hypothetical protein